MRDRSAPRHRRHELPAHRSLLLSSLRISLLPPSAVTASLPRAELHTAPARSRLYLTCPSRPATAQLFRLSNIRTQFTAPIRQRFMQLSCVSCSSYGAARVNEWRRGRRSIARGCAHPPISREGRAGIACENRIGSKREGDNHSDAHMAGPGGRGVSERSSGFRTCRHAQLIGRRGTVGMLPSSCAFEK